MEIPDIRTKLGEHLEKLTAFRHLLHQHPEVSWNERNTVQRIREFIETWASPVKLQPIAGTGLLVVFDSGVEGRHCMLRADIDALPITEKIDRPYQSTAEGVSHKCGHDGHTAILLGVCLLLSEVPLERGKVSLLFQPAEEVGEGAKAVLSDPIATNLEDVDLAFALHNLPGYELKQVILREGTFTSNVRSLIIRLTGQTSHAAEPEKGRNPAMAIAEILQNASSYNVPDSSSEDFFLVTPVHASFGRKAYGVSAGEGEVHFTLRNWSVLKMQQTAEAMSRAFEQIAHNHDLESSMEWTQEFTANVNDREAARMIREAARELDLDILEPETPFRWGEDFGLYTTKMPGAMFGLGAGLETPALHSPGYDFPDSLIQTGSLMFYTLLRKTQESYVAHIPD